MPMTPREMIRILKKHGYIEISQNDSHKKLYNEALNKTIIVPYHSKELKKGLEQSILKQAGIDKEEL